MILANVAKEQREPLTTCGSLAPGLIQKLVALISFCGVLCCGLRIIYVGSADLAADRLEKGFAGSPGGGDLA